MTGSIKAETQILLGLIAVFAIGCFASLLLKAPPIITAVCVSLIVTACLYRFLGGVEGSRLAIASFKAGGSVAVCFAVAFYVNQQLALQDRSISPDPS